MKRFLCLLMCVLLLCTNFFGLRGEGKAAPDPTAAPTAASSHYGESAEYHAARDWLDFTSAYDPDGSILQSAVAEGGTDYAGDYTMYRVYSQELAGKLEEIVERYALSLHKSMSFCYGGDELMLYGVAVQRPDHGDYVATQYHFVAV